MSYNTGPETKINREHHETHVKHFLNTTLGRFNVKYGIVLDDDRNELFTSYQVTIVNTNESSRMTVHLQSDGQHMELLLSDSFNEIDEEDLLGWLFKWSFDKLTDK